ncbi:glycosyltransferase family 2 protein [Sinorhizobium meliloti]|nr:glycosyltransferase family 2 protein [Sinorhizobium meliloti]
MSLVIRHSAPSTSPTIYSSGCARRTARRGIPCDIIVVDNDSFKDPVAVCSQVEGVRLEREPNPGPDPARNRGALVAKAELLPFVDADCVVQPGWPPSHGQFPPMLI